MRAPPEQSARFLGEMVNRIKAAVDARTDDHFVVMARTDAVASEGVQAGIDRAAAYVEAGADMIFAEALYSLEDYRAFTRAVRSRSWRISQSLERRRCSRSKNSEGLEFELFFTL